MEVPAQGHSLGSSEAEVLAHASGSGALSAPMVLPLLAAGPRDAFPFPQERQEHSENDTVGGLVL